MTKTDFWQTVVGQAHRVSTMAMLLAMDERPDFVILGGYSAPNDGGGGIFYWTTGSTAIVDGGTVVSPTSGPSGRYRRIYDGPVRMEWFGLTTNGISDLRSLPGNSGKIADTYYKSSYDDGSGGRWFWRGGDQSANITADPDSNFWVAPNSDTTGASGAWHRIGEGVFKHVAINGNLAGNSTLSVNGYTYIGNPLAQDPAYLGSINIASISKANPGVVTTAAAHGLTTGTRVTFTIPSGMTQLEGVTTTITVINSTSFSIPINTTSYSTYTDYTTNHGRVAPSGTNLAETNGLTIRNDVAASGGGIVLRNRHYTGIMYQNFANDAGDIEGGFQQNGSGTVSLSGSRSFNLYSNYGDFGIWSQIQGTPKNLVTIRGANSLSLEGYFGIGTQFPISKLTVQGDAPGLNTSWNLSQFTIWSNNTNQRLSIGYDTTNDQGVLQAGLNGSPTVYKTLALNPNGGSVTAGTVTVSALGDAWTSFSPTITPSTGTFTSASVTGKYRQIGKTLWVTYVVTITTNGTAAGNYALSLPNSSTAKQSFAGSGADNGTGYALSVSGRASSNSVFVFKYDGTYSGSTGALQWVTLCCEIN